jgi:aldehyde dehydrogenase (NAD+)
MLGTVQIKDDVSVIDRAMLKCKATYATNKTRPLSYRI